MLLLFFKGEAETVPPVVPGGGNIETLYDGLQRKRRRREEADRLEAARKALEAKAEQLPEAPKEAAREAVRAVSWLLGNIPETGPLPWLEGLELAIRQAQFVSDVLAWERMSRIAAEARSIRLMIEAAMDEDDIAALLLLDTL